MEEKHELDIPILTPDKPLYVFMNELKEHTLAKIKPKYDLILEFINKSFNLQIKSLKYFKKYNFSKLDMDNFEKILYEYKYKLEGELNIEIDDLHINVIKILSDCLDSINYSIHSHKEKTEEKNLFLTIIDEPKKNQSENKNIIPQKVKEFEKENNKIKKNKKKQILKFVNEFLETGEKIKSLTQFENIDISNIDEEKQKK
jgi:hypothetical protein